MSLISFGSDNHSGVHPLIMDAMVKANEGYAPAYEQDEWSRSLKKIISQNFEATDSAIVFNGTAANVICLQMALESYQAVLCADTSHLHLDECGAPEKIAGIKLLTLPTKHGKIVIDEIENFIVRKGDQHHSQIKMLSITQPTEYGTVYSLNEINAIHSLCQKHDLYLHIDGARLANAAVHLNCSLLELVKKADVISFGGAKNGLMLGEFVIVRNQNLKSGLRFFRKQSLQLPAKTRFLSAGFLQYFENNLWQEIAAFENKQAQSLRFGLETIPEIQITRPTQANSVFCQIPRDWIKKLRKEFFFYVWDEKSFEVRLMTSFATRTEHIDTFIKTLKAMSHR